MLSALYLATRLELATGLEKRRKTVGISYQLPTADIGIDWVQSTSAFDGEKIKIISMYIDLAIDESWSANLELGMQSANEVDDVTFGYLSLSYYW